MIPVLYILLSTLVTPSAWEMLTLEEAMLCMLNSSSLPLSRTLELNLPKRHVVMQTNNSSPLNVYFSIKDEDRSFFSTYPLTRKYHPGAKHFSPHPVSSVELSYTVFPVMAFRLHQEVVLGRRVLRFCWWLLWEAQAHCHTACFCASCLKGLR